MMKTILALFIILGTSCKIHSQSEDWNFYDFDSIVAISMPFDVFEIDTIINQKKYIQMFSSKENTSFIVQKVNLNNNLSSLESFTLPKNKSQLETFYLEYAWLLDEMDKLKLKDYELLVKDNLIGLQIKLASNTNKITRDGFLCLINNNLYSFFYTNNLGIEDDESTLFFNSIQFHSEVELLQFPKKSIFSFTNILIGLSVVFLFSFLIRFRKK